MRFSATHPKKKTLIYWLTPKHHGSFAIYLWHGMGAAAWWRLLRRNRFAMTWDRVPQVLTTTIAAPFNSALRLASDVRYRRALQAYEIEEDPIFIIGHWRTGTTWLHELLTIDQRLGCPTTYECFLPGHFLLTEPIARFWFNLIMPTTRPQDGVAVGHDRPQEDEFALMILGVPSPYMFMALPRRGPLDMDYLDLNNLDGDRREAWKRGFYDFVKRVSFRQRRRLVLKSPTHTARMRTLLELFPKARFIHIARDPLAVYHSTLHTWRAMISTQTLQSPFYEERWLDEFVLSTFERMYRRYEEDCPLVPEGQLVEITYEDLIVNPIDNLRYIYRCLDLDGFEQVEPQLRVHLSKQDGYQTNDYRMMPIANSTNVVRRWQPYFERFGYDVPVD